MKLTEEQKAKYREHVRQCISDSDIEIVEIIRQIANETHKKISKSFVPHIDSGRFGKHNADEFIKTITSLVAMIAAKEVFHLINSGFGSERVVDMFMDRFKNAMIALSVEKDNPGAWRHD
jgi:hypothetical protein